jgi:hypothetical protein
MNYDYNYRIGLYVQKEGIVSTLNAYDICSYYSNPPKQTFKPIRLTEFILEACGFRKSKVKFNPSSYSYYKDPILLVRRPFTSKFYCFNVQNTVPDF